MALTFAGKVYRFIGDNVLILGSKSMCKLSILSKLHVAFSTCFMASGVCVHTHVGVSVWVCCVDEWVRRCVESVNGTADDR